MQINFTYTFWCKFCLYWDSHLKACSLLTLGYSVTAVVQYRSAGWWLSSVCVPVAVMGGFCLSVTSWVSAGGEVAAPVAVIGELWLIRALPCLLYNWWDEKLFKSCDLWWNIVCASVIYFNDAPTNMFCSIEDSFAFCWDLCMNKKNSFEKKITLLILLRDYVATDMMRVKHSRTSESTLKRLTVLTACTTIPDSQRTLTYDSCLGVVPPLPCVFADAEVVVGARAPAYHGYRSDIQSCRLNTSSVIFVNCRFYFLCV